MDYELLRSETYTDSEGDEAERFFYRGSDGKLYVSGPGYFMLPVDEHGNIQMPSPDTPVRFVNYSASYPSSLYKIDMH